MKMSKSYNSLAKLSCEERKNSLFLCILRGCVLIEFSHLKDLFVAVIFSSVFLKQGLFNTEQQWRNWIARDYFFHLCRVSAVISCTTQSKACLCLPRGGMTSLTLWKEQQLPRSSPICNSVTKTPLAPVPRLNTAGTVLVGSACAQSGLG